MAESKIVTSIHVIIDTENAYDNIGDIDGGCFDKTWLVNHIRIHGPDQLLKKISYMNHQVYSALLECIAEKENNQVQNIKVEN